MFRLINCYDAKIGILTTDQFRLDPVLGEKVTDWWKDNRDRPLWKIQVEAIDTAIKFMETVDRDKASPGFPPGHKLPPGQFEAVRKRNLAILQELRALIEARKEEYRPTSVDGRLGLMIGLPWSIRRAE